MVSAREAFRAEFEAAGKQFAAEAHQKAQAKLVRRAVRGGVKKAEAVRKLAELEQAHEGLALVRELVAAGYAGREEAFDYVIK